MKKTLSILAALGLFVSSVQPASALVILDHTYEDLVENMMNAQSVEFSADIDFTTMSDYMEQPITMHTDIDGAFDSQNIGYADFGFWMDADGYFDEHGLSILSTEDQFYMSEDGEVWSVEDSIYVEEAVQSTNQEDINEFIASMQELFATEIVTYRAQTVEMINNTLTVRYDYEVDPQRVIDYYVDEGFLTEYDAAEIRDFFEEHVTIEGSFWIDTFEMYPVMFTLNVDHRTSDVAYTTFGLSILFKSFNQPVEVEAPEQEDITDEPMYLFSALPMEDAADAAAQTDLDADGLSNEEEAAWGTSSLSADSDNDGYDDYTEIVNGYNPNGSGILDSDGDGLTDYNELTIHWSDPYNADTDGDGYADGVEIANGYDPNGSGRW